MTKFQRLAAQCYRAGRAGPQEISALDKLHEDEVEEATQTGYSLGYNRGFCMGVVIAVGAPMLAYSAMVLA